MTITVVTDDANSGTGATLPLTLTSTEGNVQQVYAAHRTGSLTPDIDGTGWTQALVETLIGINTARRAIVRFRRIVPAGASTTINVGWTTSADIVVWGIEITTDTAGGTWVFDGADDTTHATDNGAIESTSLASSSITPSNNEAFAIDSLCARHGAIRNSNEDTYSDSFVVGPGDNTVSGNLQNNLSGFSGYKIVDVTPAAMSTTASWTTSALATSLFDVWSVSSGGGSTVAATPGALTLNPIAVTPNPGPVSVAATPGTVTLTPVAVTPTPGPVSVAATPGVVTLTPVAVGQTPGAVSVAATPGTLTLTPVPVTAGSAVTATPGLLTLTPVAVTATPGPISVAATPGTITLTPVAVGQNPGPAAVTATPGTLILEPVAVFTDVAESVVTSQGTHSLTATSDGRFQLTAVAAGLHNLIADGEGSFQLTVTSAGLHDLITETEGSL